MYHIEDKEEKTEKPLQTNPATPCNNPATAGGGRFSAEFRAAFKLVAEHYGCSEVEVREMKAAVRADIENATRCYLALEREILGAAKGINERIRAELAEAK